MPKMDKVISLQITPEQFLNACTASELQEIELLLQSRRYQEKMNGVTVGSVKIPERVSHG